MLSAEKMRSNRIHVQISSNDTESSLRNSITLTETAQQGRKRLVHMFWVSSGDTLNRKVDTALRSALRTQKDTHLILWTIPSSFADVFNQTKHLLNFICPSKATFEVKSISEILRLLKASTSPDLQKCIPSLSSGLEGRATPNSDLLRFLALYFYGGIYVDADTMFLKDLHDFDGLSFAFKWDRGVKYYNTAIMGLPKNSIVVPKIIKHFGRCNPGVFHPIGIRKAFNCSSGVCKDMIMMPTALFNPTQAPQSNWQWQKDAAFKLGLETQMFFDKPRLWEFEHFFPGSYTFHWHNKWKHPIVPNSFFTDIEQLNLQCEFRHDLQ